MKGFLFVTFLFLLVSGVFAQDTVTISGSVTSNGKPESRAIVELRSRGNRSLVRSATTDTKGDFSFDNIPPGKYTVSATREKGKSQIVGAMGSQTVVVGPGEGLIVYLKLDLYPSSINESVTVSAGQEQTIEQVSKTVDVIDGQQMRDRADFTLVDSLRSIPGFRVQQSGGFGRLATIKTRGLRNQDTAVLIDGVRFRDPTAITGDASAFLSDLTLTSVSEVEVLRGSGSSLYGTNAIGGVIDFQTPEAKSGTHGQIGGVLGGYGLRRFRGNISKGTENGKFGVTSGFSRTQYAKGIDGQDQANNTNFQTRLDSSNLFIGTFLSGRIFFSDADVRLNSNPDTFGALPASNSTVIKANPGVNFVPDANDPDSIQRSRFFSGQISASKTLGPRFIVEGYYHGLTTRRSNDNGPLGVGFQSASSSTFEGRIHTANVHLTFAGGAHNTLTSGYEFELERFRNDGMTSTGIGNFFTKAGQRSHTFYAQDLVSLFDGNLQLAGGVRVQRYSLAKPGFSLMNAPYNNLMLTNPPTAVTFDGAASYFLKKSGTKFRAHVGNGYRVPSLYERFGTFFSTFPSNSFIAIGDPFLKPEKTIAYDAGIEQYIGKFAVEPRVRLSATYFYTKLIDIIGYGNVVPNIGTTTRPFGGYENEKGGHAQGGEFSVKAQVAYNTEVFASYTFTQSTQLTPQVFGSGVLKTLGVPDHQFTAVITQRFGWRTWVNFDFLATSTYLAPIFSNSVFDTYIYRFKGNRRGDVTGGYTFPFKKGELMLRVYGTVENVFGQEYFENGFRTIGRTARAGTTFGF